MAKSTATKKVQTKKTGEEVSLPQQQDIVFVANRVIEASYNYSLIQEKIFNFLLFELQQAIKLSMNNQDYRQLALFKSKNSTTIRVRILLRNLATPNNYLKVREAAAVMGKEQIRIKIVDENGKPATRIVQLFVAVETPDEGVRDSYLKIDMSEEVAQMLIDMDKRADGKAINYTSFILQVATGAVTNKYTPRIYKLISSWKNKTGFYQPLDDFRKWLGLKNDTYKSFAELKRNVLVPVQKDLEGKSDCWFNCAEKDFLRKEGNAVVGINWKVIKPELEEKTRIQQDSIRNMLKMHFFVQDSDFAVLGHLFGSNFNYEKLTLRLFELRKYITENSSTIKNKRQYVLASLGKMKGKEPKPSD